MRKRRTKGRVSLIWENATIATETTIAWETRTNEGNTPLSSLYVGQMFPSRRRKGLSYGVRVIWSCNLTTCITQREKKGNGILNEKTRPTHDERILERSSEAKCPRVGTKLPPLHARHSRPPSACCAGQKAAYRARTQSKGPPNRPRAKP
eukprot:scaffold775_cov274-Pinguiococcus_pyrenoidosus.AAC.17